MIRFLLLLSVCFVVAFAEEVAGVAGAVAQILPLTKGDCNTEMTADLGVEAQIHPGNWGTVTLEMK